MEEATKESELTEQQITQVQAVFERMAEAAVEAGAAYLEAERDLEKAFASDAASPDLVQRLTQKAGHARALLQAVHLNAHLETRQLLHDHQIQLYAKLRGYHLKPAEHQDSHTHRH